MDGERERERDRETDGWTGRIRRITSFRMNIKLIVGFVLFLNDYARS